ncbi:hypothetical protein D3A95_10400 [Thermosynechococcus sichuanensis E542]|uniref:Uncharacterized protein n=1 Tax=Thermosynechococcus sichuanensis E542 TaxID=2016101 RepID=A0A3B7MFD5_9CYAN|nr:hypothetical protein [Thermosynechococcus vestitus]AXY68348.1 hypothetical protein D3A95_10400 [Thermosynechococcus vestitus E542]
MVFIIPIIFGAVAAATAVMGAAAGADGLNKMQQAEAIAKKAEERYESKKKDVQATEKQTRKQLNEYGYLTAQIKKDTVGRFVELAERLKQKLLVSEFEFFQGFEGATFSENDSFADNNNIGNIGETLAVMGVTAAATNATLAWLGGGALAAGGGGMALGTLVLGGFALGSALMVGGFMIDGDGEKALTEATEYAAKVEAEIAKMDAYIDYLENSVQRRVRELESIVKSLNSRCQPALDELEIAIQQGFSIQRDAEKFQRAFLLVKALMEIMRTPLFDLIAKGTKILNIPSC